MKLIFFLLVSCGIVVYAQENEPIEIINSDVFEFVEIEQKKVRKLIGNVVLKQKNTWMYCDSAYHFTEENSLQAYGHVRMTMDDTTQLTGNKLFYNGNTQLAEVFDNVTLTNQQTTLKTQYLKYDRNTKIAEYPNQGKLYNAKDTLIAKTGKYFVQLEVAHFYQDVHVWTPDYHIKTDTLIYNTENKQVFILSPTLLTGRKDTLNAYAEHGNILTEQKHIYLYQNCWFRDSAYFAKADTFYYWDDQDSGKALCNALLLNKDTSIVLYADLALWNSREKKFWATQDPYLIHFMKDDTLTLFADTLFTIQDTAKKQEKITAWKKVQVISRSFQARCDTLVYDLVDSLFIFTQEPKVWTDSSQIVGDTLFLWLKNQNPDSLFIPNQAFLISQQDSIGFNQLKGQALYAKFLDQKVHWMLIRNDAESIYFAKDGDKYLGMNQAKAYEIEVFFEENKPSIITFKQDSDATYYPMHEIWFEKNQLQGFRWMPEQKPKGYWQHETNHQN